MSKVTAVKCGHCGAKRNVAGRVNKETNRKSPYLKHRGIVLSCPQCKRADLLSVEDSLLASGASSSAPGVVLPGASQSQTEALPPDELEYRTMLQEALMWVTRQVMEEHADEIKQRAADRVRTLVELRR